jgi:hypothetical protein
MVTGFIAELLSYFQQLDTVLLIAFFLIFIILAYKIFQTMIKSLIVGIIAATFPIVANLFLGMDVPITFSSIIWFGVFGVVAFLAYSFITGGVKMVRIALSPFRLLFRKKDGAVKEKEKEKD